MGEHEKKDEESRQPEKEPTREAFFSDLKEMEDSIVEEALQLVREALSLIEKEEKSKAIELLRQAMGLYEQVNKLAEVEALKNKINEILSVREIPSEQTPYSTKQELADIKMRTDLKQIREDEMSNQAYELMGKAAQYVNDKMFDEAIKLYQESIKLFSDLQWESEVKRVEAILKQVMDARDQELKRMEYLRQKKQQELEKEKLKEKELLEKARMVKEKQLQAQAAKLQELSIKKLEEEQFQQKITKMVNAAEKLARDYESEVKKAVKTGKLPEKPVYPRVIEIYESIRDMLLEKGWKEQAKIYQAQIHLYKEKLQKDLKLREIEARKLQKEKEFKELQKVTPKREKIGIDLEKLEELTEKQGIAPEKEKIMDQMEKLVNKAEKLAREHEVEFKKAIKEKNLNIESKYPEVIELYTEARNLAAKEGLTEELMAYSSQIRKYSELLEKEKQIIELEIKKMERDKEFEDIFKIKSDKRLIGRDIEKLKMIEEAQKKQQEDLEAQEQIKELINQAEKLAREYEIEFKKAIKEKRLDILSKYPEIIKIYERIREIAKLRGWQNEVEIYNTQIRKYRDLIEKEKKIIELEHKKIQKEKEFEALQKIRPESQLIGQDIIKIKELQEKQKIEELNAGKRKEVDDLVNKAEKMAREYEIEFKKAIKEKRLNIESKYPEIINLYEKAREIALEQGWNDFAEIYSTQVKKFRDLYKKEKKIIEFELKKIERDREYEEMFKLKPETFSPQKGVIQVEKVEKIDKASLDEGLKKTIDDIIQQAEKIAREYELNFKKAIKEGNLNIESKYPEIIKLYKKARELAFENGLVEETAAISTQIRKYEELLKKEKKIIELELEKQKKEQEFKELQKVKPEQVEAKKIFGKKRAEELKRKKEEEAELRKQVDEIVQEAERIAREHEANFKKAIREGNLDIESRYPEVIELYIKAKKIATERNWADDVIALSTQIRKYEDLLEKEKKIIELELEKQKKEREFKEMQKIEPEQVEAKKMLEKKRAEELQRQKEEEAELRKQVDEIVQEAEKLAREHEINFKKAIKEGNLDIESKYPEVIDLYKRARNIAFEKGWVDETAAFSTQVRKYEELLAKEKKIIELELEKQKKEQEFKELQKVEPEKIEAQKLLEKKKAEELRKKKEEEAELRKQVDEIVQEAERIAREHEADFKKAIKEGNLDIESKYPRVIELYNEAREIAFKRGWTKEVAAFDTQIRKFEDLLEKEKKIIDLELEKQKKEQEFQELQKVEPEKIEAQKLLEKEKAEELRRKKEEEAELRRQVDEIIQEAEKIAREYEANFKKAIKEGNLDIESKYPEVIELYEKAKNIASERRWMDDVAAFSTQIRKYEDLMEKEKKIIDLEFEKQKKDLEFEELKKYKDEDFEKQKILEKQKKLEEIERLKREEEEFERQIDDIVDSAEKMAREYEKQIKAGNFEVQCPYLELAEVYTDLYAKVKAKGWTGEAELYAKQAQLYRQKFYNDKRLREIEMEKLKRHQEFMEAIKSSKEKMVKIPGEDIQLKAMKDEKSDLWEKAINLIDKAEKLVSEYELLMKKEMLTRESPYEQAIELYKEAHKLFKQAGSLDDAKKIFETIKFYKEKKVKDDKLRELEQRRVEEGEKEELVILDVASTRIERKAPKILDKERKVEEKALSEEIFSLLDEAESLANIYKQEIKSKGILNVNCPYERVIKLYKQAQEKFKEIGWMEQASKLNNSIQFYKEKLDLDKKLRLLEEEKLRKQEEEMIKQQIRVKISEELENEMKLQREKALELKQKEMLEYESKKEQAFNLIDLAKEKLEKNQFDEAIRYYNESKEIFAEISWAEGIRMINESIRIIKTKKEEYEREIKKLEEKEIERMHFEEQLEKEIQKVEELEKIQQEIQKEELLTIQELKKKEKEISEEAYKLIEEGAKLREIKQFDRARESFLKAREKFKEIGWKHEMSRIDNDILPILKREKEEEERLRILKQKMLEEKEQLESLLKEAESQQKIIKLSKKEEKRKKREEYIHKELEKVNAIIRELKYNKAVLKLKEILELSRKMKREDFIKEINEQIVDLKTKSQVPIITVEDVEKEHSEKIELAYIALDNAQISISKNKLLKAITELNEATYNLRETSLNEKYIPVIEEKINELKSKLGKTIKAGFPKEEKEVKAKVLEQDELRAKIAARRRERRKKIQELLKE